MIYWRCSFSIKTRKASTFILEAADHAGRGCSRVVLVESPVQLQHVLRWLLAGGGGPPICEVHGGQKVAEKVPGVEQRIVSSRRVRAEGTACAQARQRRQQDVQPEDGADGHAHGRAEERGERCKIQKARRHGGDPSGFCRRTLLWCGTSGCCWGQQGKCFCSC